jgi:hypothetical protein
MPTTADTAAPEIADQLVHIYKAKSEIDARAAFEADASMLGHSYDVVSSTWQAGKRRLADKIAAVCLCFVSVGLGIIPVILWLIFGRPIGTLTVVLRTASGPDRSSEMALG